MARKQGSTTDNISHLFAELDPDQPANAIVNFVTKMIGTQKRWALMANLGVFSSSVLSTTDFFPLLFWLVNECKQMKDMEHVWCILRLYESMCQLHGRTPEGIRGSAEWGSGYVLQRDGRPLIGSPWQGNLWMGWGNGTEWANCLVSFFLLRKCQVVWNMDCKSIKPIDWWTKDIKNHV